VKSLVAVGVYQPAWQDGRKRRTLGPDEDVATLAVSAGDLLHAHLDKVKRVILITRVPDALLGTISEVVLEGLGLKSNTPVEERLGGAPSVLDALLSGADGTLVIAIDPVAPAGAGAVLVGKGSISLEFLGAERFTMPVRTRLSSELSDRVYDDPRLLRERGWRRAAGSLTTASCTVIAGLTEKESHELSATFNSAGSAVQAAATIFGIASMIDEHGAGSLVALEGGLGIAATVNVSPGATVERDLPAPLNAPASWTPRAPGSIPVSVAAYERAFEAKVGFKVGVCECGQSSYPPRIRCTNCGLTGGTRLVPMTKDGVIYSLVRIHTPVPGRYVPYSLALVEVEDRGIRALVHVTDDGGTAAIGCKGRLVLRRIAVRDGISDYGFALRVNGESCEK